MAPSRSKRPKLSGKCSNSHNLTLRSVTLAFLSKREKRKDHSMYTMSTADKG